MKTITIPVLDEKDDQTIDRLVGLGLRRDVSEVIMFLDHIEESTAKDIEHGTGRRVTEVSRALRAMRKRGWVCESRHYNPVDGHLVPYFRNSLSLAVDEIIDELEKVAAREQCG